ncbi:hypothetical protein GCM10028803_19040 [Larkinella knui]|uniref:Uncharacterized protein n=1 Tax=Larkinella knui TaxID=2025310 RepID=A0A3P1CUR1_9BACT|nr:hypothetical protein [Larkinella knui]RRB17001.1 hypothetical protein EHT87_01580 [Larkinella knui]
MKSLFKLGVAIDCMAVLYAIYDALAGTFLWPELYAGRGLLIIALCGTFVALAIYSKTRDQISLSTVTSRLPAFPLLGFGLMMLLIAASNRISANK